MHPYLNIPVAVGIAVVFVFLLGVYIYKPRHKRSVKIRDARLTIEELENYARETAFDHALAGKSNAANWPIPRMNENYKYIFSVYRSLNEDVLKLRSTTPAAEWLLDNYYIIEEQVKSIRRDLTKKAYSLLPALKHGPLKGYARIYAIALDLVSHTDGRVDDKILANYLKAYQSHTILLDKELWVLSIMIRLSLIENIRYVCEKILEAQTQRRKADELLDNLSRGESQDPEKLFQAVENYFKGLHEINPAFIEHLSYRLRKMGKVSAHTLQYIDEILAKYGMTIESVTQKEHTAQAVRKVSIENCIVSLKFISSFDWVEIFESLSQVEQTLRQDPGGIYPYMDLRSRNYYRKKVEELSRLLNVPETHIAKEAVELAQNTLRGKPVDSRLCHVGYYLVGKGVAILESRLGYRPSLLNTFKRAVKRNPTVLYLGTIALVTLILTGLVMNFTFRSSGDYRIILSILAGILVFIPSSDIAVSLINWILSHTYRPAFIPKLELKEGIPDNLSTMVVIPALIPDEKRVKELIGHLEVHYLANKEKNLYFALAGDFKDSPEKDMPGDSDIISAALEMVRNLNIKYAKDGRDVFYYFHRYRQFNEKQNKWMGWERKRGALIELNDLLLGSRDTSYSVLSGDPSQLPPIKYIITLDADTILPLDAAKRLIGTMAHPLNSPVIDRSKGIVTDGYGLMQPRIGVDIESSGTSLFSQIFAGEYGIDPYTNAVSDVYQDVFGEGIFTGKGIYDLAVFQQVLKNTVPTNTVLSHDLLEGSYVRTGLITDIELIDGYPSKYSSYAARMHRWVRGDWQLTPWLGSTVRNSIGNRVKNPLSLISKWKILDNLRRSLVSPALMLLIAAGFSFLPGDVLIWLGFAVLCVAFPLVTGLIDYILSKRFHTYITKQYLPVIHGIKATLLRVVLLFMLLPYQAYLMAGAIGVTLIRVYVTKKNLLEWVTASDAEKKLKNDIRSSFIRMRVSFVEALIIVLLSFMFKPYSIYAAAALFIVWSASPFVAYWISKTAHTKPLRLSSSDIAELRRFARKTWRYFEEFVTYRTSYLPPDNYQEDPLNGIAYRTSPTNIGLALLSTVSARDLGYIPTSEMVDLVGKIISTVEIMEKWNGHLYNWYDVRTLQPLWPRYVSTVDSGNFVSYLMTLSQSLIEYLERPLTDTSFVDGIRDTVRLINKDSDQYYPDFPTIGEADGRKAVDLTLWARTLQEFTEKSAEFSHKKSRWKGKLDRMLELFRRELENLTPWVSVLTSMPEAFQCDREPFPAANILTQLQNLDVPLAALPDFYREITGEIDKISDVMAADGDEVYGSTLEWLSRLRESLHIAADHTAELIERCRNLIDRINAIADAVEFIHLYDEKKQLFSIGYDIENNKLTNSYYDLLASEARQTSFLVVARREVDQKHWFKLSRTLTIIDGYKGLISWSGTMFEYLMPLLVMKSYKNTLLDETHSFAVRSQKKYGRQRHVPWGTSESGFYSLDINLDYQYKALGVPWLGLKRGLIEDVVVAPYATMLALMVDPKGAVENLKRLKNEGGEGPYGFYEAIDYTPERLPFGSKNAIVKSFMAHHQGMSLLSLNNFLNMNIMQERFHANPVVKAAQLLLQEKVPANIVFTKENKEKIIPFKNVTYTEGDSLRIYSSVDPLLPKAHILSNGSYSVLVTDRGTGYSRNKNIAVTRWREDVTLDNYGMFFYIRNVDTNTVWSATYAPYGTIPETYEVIFTSDKATYLRRDGDIETQTEIVVAPGDNAEIRRISLTNHGQKPYTLEVSSYFEVVLTSQGADVAHPAFSNLFIRTEFIPEFNSLLAHRRPRSENGKALWAINTMTVDGEAVGGIQYETDRLQFIGRGHTVSDPAVLKGSRPLSNTAGPVLDPIMSLRLMVRVEPGQTAKISYIAAVSETRDTALELAEKYSTPEAAAIAFRLALTRSRVEARYLNLKAFEIELYQDMISHILYISPLQRLKQDCIMQNRKGQSSLWPYGISGDLPIVLVTLKKPDEVDIVYEMLKAHEYWRIKDLKVDLVILNEEGTSYTSPLHNLLSDIVSSSYAHDVLNKPGGVFVIRGSNIPEEDKTLLCAVARIILKGSEGSLSEQMQQPLPHRELPEPMHFSREPKTYNTPKPEPEELYYFNGVGGFSPDGREYVIRLEKDLTTPLPWVNIISNPLLGFLVSESGSGYTWNENSRENKLSPWSNDPVSDTPGEIIYLQDEQTGELWTSTPLPIRENEPYTIRHGFGYSVFQHTSHGIEQEMSVFVPIEEPVKISIIRLKNLSDSERNLGLTYYVRPVLGVNDQLSCHHIVTKKSESGTLLFENPFNEDFAGRIAFMDVSEDVRSVTGDRKEFFGNGGPVRPEGLGRQHLSGTVGAGYDPCAAMRTTVHLGPGEEKELVFTLGMAGCLEEVSSITGKYRDISEAKKALREVTDFWNRKLSAIQVATPDPSMDFMINGWLLYQTIACRLWARSGFYQSGGAYGFRDQLQDVMSVAHIWPEIACSQILRHAAHQFPEGDVQHWWHEPQNRGTRTRSSDDRLWLPYVVSEYVRITGDLEILKKDVPFVEGDQLKEFEDEIFIKPAVSETVSSVYDHCVRAIERSLNFGDHGIPLIGSGDWNDGMNAIGNKGKGESIWLGWFLYSTLVKFAPLCRAMGDREKALKYMQAAEEIAYSIEKNAWDGSWYRRAYFDNGTPLGSVQNDECKIDSISQSWAVISGGANPDRAREAMNSVENYLIKREEGLIKLLTPPFDEGELEPGYIKGYVPGVRENGGQYTHAAAWVVLAFAKLGEGDKAWDFFELINPINHARTHIEYSKYKVEPYVAAADVYAVDPHTGRGGWTWYTGSAGWMYRVGLEYILGFQKNGQSLVIDPCIPSKWSEYHIYYRYGNTRYAITVRNPDGVNKGIKSMWLDGRAVNGNTIPLADDGLEHKVEVYMGKSEAV